MDELSYTILDMYNLCRYMASKDLHPLKSSLRTVRFLIQGRLHFPKERIGEQILLDGEPWIIFRQAILDPWPNQPQKPGAIFRPRFHVRGMSLHQNILFSWLPIPFYVGLPGFRSKLWMYNQATGDFAGYYEWDTVEDAQNYSQSFAAKFMMNRSVPGSVSFRVIPT